MPTPNHLDEGWRSALAWGCYLGSSWTWVIAMFFPVMLLRDFGLWGWVAFAVPNVFGAAAMGAVLNAESSRRLVAQHRDMCIRFSEVTIALHAFVLGWLYTRLFGASVVVIALGAAVFIQVAVHTRPRALALGVWITLGSLILFVLGLVFGFQDAFGAVWNHPRVAQRVTLDVTDLGMFALAAVVGFGLCPYLDLTFHRARQATGPKTGRRAFLVGFGLIFLAMIVFSLAYASMLQPLLNPADTPWQLPTEWVSVLMLHLTLQAAFTMGCHGREVTVRRGEGAWLRLALIAALGLAVAAIVSRWIDLVPHERAHGETIYRIFLLAYGLAFPAYVFLCVIAPWRGAAREQTKVIAWVLATIAALPMAYRGFVSSDGLWIAGSLAVLCITRLGLEFSKPRTLGESLP